MLDKETKDRINTARDILVGKVPDPKSQVEQITIALIYKFMDDMDLEAEELGGARSFFTGEYEKYAWHKLFAPSMGGEQRLLLYSEALLKLSQNPKLPGLFRDIFKNAYLPYRDPETLSSFLKEINKFSYDHSERLGDAFEFLLSVLGSQGDAGQFRTPRHLIDFMVAVADPRKDETILDPACGTAGFLISSYKHILRHNTAKGKSTLTPDERRRLAENFRGYDISPDMVRLSLVNLYLHGFAEPRIHEYDTLTSEDRWNEYYDIVLANPPFMSPKGGIRPHKRFRIASNRSEVLFVDYIAEHLSTQGRAAVIVPEGIIFQSGTAYKELRKMLVDGGFLMGVISLPAGVFNPYSGVKTSILWMDKSLAKKTDKLLFVKIENDGYDLGAQRRELKSSDLPEALRAIETYKQAVQTGAAFDAERWGNVTVVDKERVAENGEYGLSGERYRAQKDLGHSKWEMIKLGDVFKLSSGTALTQKQMQEGRFPVYGGNGKTGLHNEYFIEKPTIVIGRVGAYCGSIHTTEPKSWVTDNGLFVTKYLIDEIDQKYLALVLEHLDLNRFAKVGGQPSISQETVYQQKIPLPPLTVQQELVAEIEGYQRVIEGARQVVESYRPRVEVEESWEWVELGEVLMFVGSGATPLGGQENYKEDGVLFIRSQNVLWGECDFSDAVFISEETHSGMSRSKVKKDDVLLNITGASIGRSAIFGLDIAANVNQHVTILRPTGNLSPHFLMYCLISDFMQNQIWSAQAGGTRQALNYQQIRSFKIPLPALATQRRIVSELEREREWVEGCRALVRGYEERVRRRVGRVWGE